VAKRAGCTSGGKKKKISSEERRRSKEGRGKRGGEIHSLPPALLTLVNLRKHTAVTQTKH